MVSRPDTASDATADANATADKGLEGHNAGVEGKKGRSKGHKKEKEKTEKNKDKKDKKLKKIIAAGPDEILEALIEQHAAASDWF
jgi:hypothetical protein